MSHTRTMFIIFIIVILVAAAWYAIAYSNVFRYSEMEAGFEEVSGETAALAPAPTFLPPIPEPMRNGRVQWSVYWEEMNEEEKRVYGQATLPPGPPRVGIQAGHWQLEAVPEELASLKQSSGAVGGGYTEQETVLTIAELTKEYLEAEGVTVDLLPATIPIDYLASAFVSIHADGSTSETVSGYKLAAPRRDFSGKSNELVAALTTAYGSGTGLPYDDNITRRMSGYYAFNWRRYDHALHPQTPAAIVETGFMTNAGDRSLLIDEPERVARAIADGILEFLKQGQ